MQRIDLLQVKIANTASNIHMFLAYYIPDGTNQLAQCL